MCADDDSYLLPRDARGEPLVAIHRAAPPPEYVMLREDAQSGM